MGLVLKRSECRELKELRNWILIYGGHHRSAQVGPGLFASHWEIHISDPNMSMV